MDKFDPYDPEENYDFLDEFHAVYTVQLGELIHDGLVDFNDGTWDKLPNGEEIAWYDDEQKKRFWDKFEQYYYWREIGELPYKRWKYNLLAKIALLMPKYNLLYGVLDAGIDPLQIENTYGKNRNIYSDFPQTLLSANEDYASSGNDYQFERITQGNFVDTMTNVQDNYIDPDFALVRELDTHFYCVLTSNINGY